MVNFHFAAPSPPQNLTFSRASNTSVALTWNRPASMNGELMYYQIFFVWNGKMKNDTQVKPESKGENPITYVLTGLQSFTTYDFMVSACTVECSAYSENVTVTTLVGAPSMIVNITSGENGLITWSQPEYRGGYLAFYELKITSSANSTRILRVSGEHTRCQLVEQFCPSTRDAFMSYDITVRGVTVSTFVKDTDSTAAAESAIVPCECYDNTDYFDQFDGESFPGNWSRTDSKHHCSPPQLSVLDVISIVVGFVALLTFLYASMIFLRKLREMADIKIILPEGLNQIKEPPPISRYDSTDSRQELLPAARSYGVQANPVVQYSTTPASSIAGNDEEDCIELRNSESQQPLLTTNLVVKMNGATAASINVPQTSAQQQELPSPPRPANQYLPMNSFVARPVATIKPVPIQTVS